MTTRKPLSKLERVPLREVWKHEANDFTPWLAETDNLIVNEVKIWRFICSKKMIKFTK